MRREITTAAMATIKKRVNPTTVRSERESIPNMFRGDCGLALIIVFVLCVYSLVFCTFVIVL